jgi:predicted secreted protein
MDLVSGFVVFFITWWTVLFAVLPWGVRPIERDEAEGGHQVGAPANPMILKKALYTTLVTCVVWMLIYVFIEMGIFSFREWAAQVDLG